MENELSDFFAREAKALRDEVNAKSDANGAASLTKGQTERVVRILRTAIALTDGDPQDVVDVELADVGSQKIQVIKAIREMTDLSLKKAKRVCDKAPSVLAEDLDPAEADKMKAVLEEQGARIEYR